jgi:hypothetical protein
MPPHVGAGASQARDLGSKVLAVGVLVALIGLVASRGGALRILALIGVCLNLWLAVSWALTLY